MGDGGACGAAFQALKHKNVINTQQISGAPTGNGQHQVTPGNKNNNHNS